MLILSNDLKMHIPLDGKKPLTNPDRFWSQCGEDDIDVRGENIRLDPVLKVYPGCPVMVTSNINVKNGEANGSQGIVQKVVAHHDGNYFRIKFFGFELNAIYATDVKEICLELDIHNEEKQIHNQVKINNIKAKPYTVDCLYPLPDELCHGAIKKQRIILTMTQFPIVSNTATTGHKLQGATKENLYIPFWHYGTENWIYVVISRVKTMDGLYFGEPLDPKLIHTINPLVTKMMDKFRKMEEQINH